MCGIAGIIDLVEQRPVAPDVIRAMAGALVHRGPDEYGFLEVPGLALASRRLSIIGLADGRQPIFNEDRSITVVFNGELFDYPEMRTALEQRGHRFATHCDTEIIPHLWEDHQESMWERMHGQFAVALWDAKARRLVLGRDRFGICPLYWTKQGKYLLFASEIKALLASGLVPARPDPRGINHVFTFFATPGPVTLFEGVRSVLPGQFLRVQLDRPGQTARISEHAYWKIDFPDHGQEDPGGDERQLVDRFEQVMFKAVEHRLRADVPVVAYLSGGVDSSVIVALASKQRGQAIPTFTIRVTDPALDEAKEAALVARHVGVDPVVVDFGPSEVLNTYPELVRAVEAPVIDTACAALLMLAREVHARGYKVTLTGEGADEWLAGYPWYKTHRLLSYLDVVPGLPLSQLARRLYLRLNRLPRFPWARAQHIQALLGGHSPWLDLYGMVAIAKLRFFSAGMWESLGDHVSYEDLGIETERLRRWHPLNRALYLGIRVQLPGLLLSAKGDRVAMNSSVEARYPFLDEGVYDFLAGLHPRWKLRGFKDKYLLRKLAERHLPREIAWRRKAMFRAPFDSFHDANVPPFVDQLLSEESLRKTGYFDAEAVQHWRQAFRTMRAGSVQRTTVEMALVGILATQLWHHTFIDGSLADLPGASWDATAGNGLKGPHHSVAATAVD